MSCEHFRVSHVSLSITDLAGGHYMYKGVCDFEVFVRVSCRRNYYG